MKSLSLTQNALWNIASTVCNFVLLFVGTPIVVRSLGNTNYGIYLLLGMLGGVLAISNCGLGEANIKYIAEYSAKKDFEAVNQTFSATFFSYLVFGGSISAVFLLFPSLISSFLNFPEQASIPTLIRIAVCLFFVNLIGGSIGAVPCALQRFDIVATIDFSQNFLRVVTVITVVSLGFDLTVIMCSVLGITIFFLTVRALIARYMIRSLRLVIPEFATFKRVFSYGIYLFNSELVGLVWQYADPMILTRYLSPAHVTFFNVPMQLIGKCLSVVSAGTNVLLPRFSAESGKNETSSENIKLLFLQGTQLGLICSILIFVPMTVLLPDFLRLWISAEFSDKAGFIGTVLAGSYIIRGAFLTYTPFLKGIGHTKVLFYVTLSSSFSILLCDIILIPVLGISGVGYSYILSSSVGVITIFYCAKKLLKISMPLIVKDVIFPYIAGVIIMGVCLYLKNVFSVPTHNWISFISAAILTEIFTIVCFCISVKIFRFKIYFPDKITRCCHG